MVGTIPLVGTDTQFEAALRARGVEVEVVQESTATRAHAEGKRLILLSYSMKSTAFAAAEAFADVPAPILVTEHNLLPRLGMVARGQHGFTPRNLRRLTLVSDDPTLTAGFPKGDLAVYARDQEMFWGVPGSGAIKVATLTGAPEKVTYFAYPPGAMMAGSRAPARRVQFFHATHSPDPVDPNLYLNESGLALLGAALDWCLSPDLLFSSGPHLAWVRQRLRAGDPALTAALRIVREEADRALTRGPWSVTHKTNLPAGADPRDYRSLGPYWWPDPAKPDGLPWIRRDGERNPTVTTDAYDARRAGEMRSAVRTLALAYFLTGHEPYAERAAHVLRVFYLDPKTRMNPHLQYAQAIPGINTGRGIGIIDTSRVPQMLDDVALLAGSPAWTEADRRGLRDWMAAYLEWLLTSTHGKDEERATNNHGSWYDVQVAALALHTGQEERARTQLDGVTRARIAAQLLPDGRQPRELERTRALAYSLFNLEALMAAALLGERVGVDLWGFATPDGRSVLRALDYLLPFSSPQAKWPHAQITPPPWSTFARLLGLARERTRDPRYAEAWARLPRGAREDADNTLRFPLAH